MDQLVLVHLVILNLLCNFGENQDQELVYIINRVYTVNLPYTYM